jgi:hypothetical protein
VSFPNLRGRRILVPYVGWVEVVTHTRGDRWLVEDDAGRRSILTEAQMAADAAVILPPEPAQPTGAGARARFAFAGRVRFSPTGLEELGAFAKTAVNADRRGTVIGFSRDDRCVYVRWDGRASRESLFHGFLDPA